MREGSRTFSHMFQKISAPEKEIFASNPGPKLSGIVDIDCAILGDRDFVQRAPRIRDRHESVADIASDERRVALRGVAHAAAAGQLQDQAIPVGDDLITLGPERRARTFRLTTPAAPGPPPSRPWRIGDAVERRLDRKFQVTLVPISMTWPVPPRVRPAPPESGFSSFDQKIKGATFSVASTGIVRTPEGYAVAFRPSDVGRAVPPELNVMFSKSGRLGWPSRGWPETHEPPRIGGFQSDEAPSAVTRSGTA